MDTPKLLDEDLLEIVKHVHSTTPEYSVPHYIYKGTTVSESMIQVLDDILNMEVREDDTWICTFPKSGTHWSAEMVWLISNDLDYKGSEIPHLQRVPSLEVEHLLRHCSVAENDNEFHVDPKLFIDSINCVKTMKSPRFIKTHMPFHMLPLQIQQGAVKAKIIYVMRNPMDVCMSYLHMYQQWYNIEITYEDFADLFMQGGRKYGT
ncbi:luciferin sulfotransferase-like [Macrosteles quadrilineatus]|uniref:luciferin sulfotransferase-like n=1 Tax=Macrosteles quadrilineatus TaxID=74068 RepID=UPI0023E1F8CC|nr:luciferin sulfotransferase-like [Macrosteles quadrilineatus]